MPKPTDDNPYYYLHKRQELYRKNTSNAPKLVIFNTEEEKVAFIKAHPYETLWDGYMLDQPDD